MYVLRILSVFLHRSLRYILVLLNLVRSRLTDCLLADDESARGSQEDCDALRSDDAVDGDHAESTLLSPSATPGRNGSSETSAASIGAVKPTFWMIDYKQPKRCKKNGCRFQTANKVSRKRSIYHWWLHVSNTPFIR